MTWIDQNQMINSLKGVIQNNERIYRMLFEFVVIYIYTTVKAFQNELENINPFDYKFYI